MRVEYEQWNTTNSVRNALAIVRYPDLFINWVHELDMCHRTQALHSGNFMSGCFVQVASDDKASPPIIICEASLWLSSSEKDRSFVLSIGKLILPKFAQEAKLACCDRNMDKMCLQETKKSSSSIWSLIFRWPFRCSNFRGVITLEHYQYLCV